LFKGVLNIHGFEGCGGNPDQYSQNIIEGVVNTSQSKLMIFKIYKSGQILPPIGHKKTQTFTGIAFYH